VHPRRASPIETWYKEAQAFFDRGWEARLSVLHAPSGHVVCLGVDWHSSAWVGAQPSFAPTGKARAEIQFDWRICTPFLPESVFKQIERGFSDEDGAFGLEVSDWDHDLDCKLPTQTAGFELLVCAGLNLAPGLPPAPDVEWEWNSLRFQADPLLSFPGCEHVNYMEYHGSSFYSMDEIVQSFLQGVADLGAA
jgi:hypothetical protein